MYIPVPTCAYVRTPRSAARRFGARVVVRTRYAYKYACDVYVVHAWDTRALVKLPLGGTVRGMVSLCCQGMAQDSRFTMSGRMHPAVSVVGQCTRHLSNGCSYSGLSRTEKGS